jgi:hypothetical protein
MKRALIAVGFALIAAPVAHAGEYRQAFKRPASEVYAALSEAVPALGYKVRARNDDLMRISVSAPMSAWSLGENMSIAVVEDGPDKSAIEVDGELKMSSNILAKGRVMKHFDRIVMAVGDKLKPAAP